MNVYGAESYVDGLTAHVLYVLLIKYFNKRLIRLETLDEILLGNLLYLKKVIREMIDKKKMTDGKALSVLSESLPYPVLYSFELKSFNEKIERLLLMLKL